jgi:molybdate/tungstate transport system ATP-binding protein
MLSVNNIKKQFGIFAIRDITFEVTEGEYFVLLGSTGAGKTVLLEMLAGMIQPNSGQILLDGRDILSERIQNRRIGLVYQDRALFPHLTVYDNICYGLRSRGKTVTGPQPCQPCRGGFGD